MIQVFQYMVLIIRVPYHLHADNVYNCGIKIYIFPCVVFFILEAVETAVPTSKMQVAPSTFDNRQTDLISFSKRRELGGGGVNIKNKRWRKAMLPPHIHSSMIIRRITFYCISISIAVYIAL